MIEITDEYVIAEYKVINKKKYMQISNDKNLYLYEQQELNNAKQYNYRTFSGEDRIYILTKMLIYDKIGRIKNKYMLDIYDSKCLLLFEKDRYEKLFSDYYKAKAEYRKDKIQNILDDDTDKN